NLSANEVMVTNGSDEALMFILMAFCDNENGIAFPNITYGFYSVFCELLSLNSTLIPLKSDYKLDVDAFVGLNKNIIIANPNAPTGIAIAINDVRKILQSNPNNIVAIDEAYVDFGAQSAVELIKEFDNLIVVQTFSKSRSLAGARLGMALSNSDIICDLNKIRFSFNPYNVNRLTDLMGKLAIEDNDYFKNCCDVIVENREYTTASLISLGFEVLPSSANFIFARKAKLSGEIFYLKLKEKGILVRYFDKPLLSDFVRISIGSRKEMEFVIKKTIEILKEECLL
ncbi:MAG: histidinol-phosphate transaminase, partial [Clostridia bacterium]